MLRNHRKIKLRSCSFCTEQTAAAQSEFNLNLMALSDRIYADTDSSKYSSRFWTLHTDSSFGFKRTVDQTAKRWDWKQSGDSVTDSLTFIAGWYQTLTHTHTSPMTGQRGLCDRKWQRNHPQTFVWSVLDFFFLLFLFLWPTAGQTALLKQPRTDSLPGHAVHSGPAPYRYTGKKLWQIFFSHKKTNLKRLI